MDPDGDGSFHRNEAISAIQPGGGDGFHRQGGGNYGGGPIVVGNGGGSDGPGGTTLFVGELHWWTTDADLEAELSKYGQVKEVRFFDEKASGKSKGYCQVDFYDPGAAAACKEGMNGHLFNGRPCVVAFASPHTVRRMGEAQVKNQQSMAQQNSAMGRMGGGFGGFPGGPGAAPFPGLMQPFPPVVAPHVNPAFFGRGGGMGAGGVGMWPDPSMGGWGGEEQSSYGDDAASDQQYGEGGSHGKERPPERECLKELLKLRM
ncbi:hypothetical protein E2562_024900 [Oryza meyeriana var. granulata]|uniref:RRM domain-containing protein n=1 Tax=Oryza meyeriana var. granulata TaxID=110450 RepID=A0A6G1DNZ9_9ORYZ|nr:hypothetical protein E2562_024900 [Oryza meyeriana var. granulata]